MSLKSKFGIFCMLVVFFNLCATQYVEHNKEDLMPGYKDNRISLTHNYAENNEMDDAEIWYSKVTDDSEEPCNSSEKVPGDKELKAMEMKEALNEEKKQLSANATIQEMLASLVEDKPKPRLHALSNNRLKTLKWYDSCPERRHRLYYYWEIPYTRMCKVIRPWNYPVTYAVCLKKSCCQNTFNALVFTRCLHCGWTRHRFVVMCYNTTTKPPYNFQWKVVTRWFPQSCDCHNFVWQPIKLLPINPVKG